MSLPTHLTVSNDQQQALEDLTRLSRAARRIGAFYLSDLLDEALERALNSDICTPDREEFPGAADLLSILEFVGRFQAAPKDMQKCLLALLEQEDEDLRHGQ